jgi:hypothetical protein
MKWRRYFLITVIAIGLLFAANIIYKNNTNKHSDIAVFTQYAVNFKLDKNDETQCGNLPNIDDELGSILLHHEKNILFKRNISLIVLKFYNCDINNYRVGHELRKNLFFYHPIVDAYYDILKNKGRTSFEFVPTTDIFDVINSEPKLLADKHILNVLLETCTIFEKKGMCKNLPFDNSICKSQCL